MKDKVISVDILKFLAALFITNSHMKMLYHPYEIMATGGAIGDVLFFFASGYTLFLGRLDRFDNWYKRRINRIYPTLFTWAIIASILFKNNDYLIQMILHGGVWFISCIMIYYVLLYLVRKYLANKLNVVFAISSAIIIIWYLLIDKPNGYNMYGETYFKWGHYFLFMLLGAYIGVSKKKYNFNFKTDIFKLIFSVFSYYGILFLGKNNLIFEQLQILSLVPLVGIVFYFYKCCNTRILSKIYYSNYLNVLIKLISGLCLEIYLVQSSLLTDKMNKIFPFNLIIMFVIILIVAYILRVFSRLFSQTFKDKDYNWSEIVRVVE